MVHFRSGGLPVGLRRRGAGLVVLLDQDQLDRSQSREGLRLLGQIPDEDHGEAGVGGDLRGEEKRTAM